MSDGYELGVHNGLSVSLNDPTHTFVMEVLGKATLAGDVLRLVAVDGQTGKLFNVIDKDGNSVFSIDRAGKVSVAGNDVVTAVLLGTGEAIDLNGETGGVVFDADANSKIYPSADDIITVAIAGADDFAFGANAFVALGGSVIQTDTINEATGLAGVTIDGALHKDGRTDEGRITQTLTASGAISINSGLVELAHNTVAIAATLDAPVAGDDLWIVDASASGTAAHTVKCGAGVTFDGTNNTATLNAPDEALHVIALSATRWYIATNNGSVGLSST